jgi:hypothetical protein
MAANAGARSISAAAAGTLSKKAFHDLLVPGQFRMVDMQQR